MYDDLNDESLMSLIAKQDAQAFTILVHRHTPLFYKIAYQFLWNSSYTNDILQDAFTKLWQQPQQFKNKGNAKFTTWFYTVVINLCKNNNRNETSIQNKNENLFEQRTIEENRGDIPQFEIVKKNLTHLSEKQKSALILHYLQGLSQKEASVIMGISQKAFESLVSRAKEKLKKIVKKEIRRESGDGYKRFQSFA